MRNPKYTNLWTDNFQETDVQRYDEKFRKRWEKHIKHWEQLAFIEKYLEDWMYWCDAPIGSGRLMRALKTRKMLGFDISDGFLEYNRKHGIPCDKGDLFDFGQLYRNEFDLITSLHSIFAFREYRLILQGFLLALKSGGLLIVDITNRLHAEQTLAIKAKIFDDPSMYPDGMTRFEIIDFFESIGGEIIEIQPNDYWDNYYFFQWRYLDENPITRRFKKYIWQMLNFGYFYLGLSGLLKRIKQGKPENRFTKYLVAVRKKQQPVL